jgi:transposase
MDEFYRFLPEKKTKKIRLAVMEIWRAIGTSIRRNPRRRPSCSTSSMSSAIFARRATRYANANIAASRASRPPSSRVRIHPVGSPAESHRQRQEESETAAGAQQAPQYRLRFERIVGTALGLQQRGLGTEALRQLAGSAQIATPETLRGLAGMVERHWDGIAAYCKPENKVFLGFVEGLKNKIRVLQRRAYGLRDEEYFRLKVLTCMLPKL